MADLASVVAYATSKEGDPYVWGASGPTSFDCSGLVAAAYKAAGFALPRTTAANYGTMGTPVPEAAAVPGDVVYFSEGGPPNGHVGIYVGGGKMIDAPHTGATVRVDNIHDFGTVTSIRDLTGTGAGHGYAGAPMGSSSATAQSTGLNLNPFSGWQNDVLTIVLKLAGAAACAALVIVGAKESVKGS